MAVAEAMAVVVSTHSRPKAAGFINCSNPPLLFCFNTQPPEGGWKVPDFVAELETRFNTQPPEGGWPIMTYCPND